MGRANRHANPRAGGSERASVRGVSPGQRHFPAGRFTLLGVALILVAVGTFATHWPVLSAQALSFDDGQFLTDNPLVQNPSWTSAGRFLGEVLEPSTVEGYYLPLSMISLMIDYAAGGRPGDLRPFHRTSLALHVINTILVIILLWSLFEQRWAAVIAGLLFGVHPLTVEPVAWIGERKTLLAAFFTLWALIFYVRYRRRCRWPWYGGSLLAYVAAVMSKPTALPLPFLLLLLDYWPLGKLSRRAVVEKAPFFAVGAMFAVVTAISHSRTAGIQLPTEQTIWHIPLNAFYLVAFYVTKIVWPVSLTSVYSLPEPFALSQPAVWLPVVGTLVLFAGVLLSWRRTRALLTGWLFFLVAIAPTLGLVRYSWITASDKYVYLPAVGLLLIVAWLMGLGLRVRSHTRRIDLRHAALAALVLLAAAAEARATRHYLRHWQDTEGLFRYMIRQAPRAHMPHYNLAHALQSQGRLAEAETEYRTVLQLSPNHLDSHNNLGLILAAQGRREEAMEHYRQALTVNPRYANALTNLGNALCVQGRYAEAIAKYESALSITPSDPRVHNALGVALFQQGKPNDAVKCYREALRLDPEHLDAYRNLGLALVTLGNPGAAIEAYHNALKLDPLDAYVHNNLGVALQRAGRIDEAIAEYGRAVRLNPAYADAITNLASALAGAGRIDEALREFRAYLGVTPRDPEVLNVLGDVLFEGGRLDDAAEAYREALEIAPEYLTARKNLGVALASQDRWAEAAREYRAVLEKDPRDPCVRNNLGAAFFEQGSLAAAVNEYREALKLAPNYAAAHYNLGRALAGLGQTEEAIEHYRAVLRINPGDVEARNELEAALAIQRRRPNGSAGSNGMTP